MKIKMVRPKLIKSMGKVGIRQYYRFELIGDGLIDVSCITLQLNLQGVKEKALEIINKFKDRQFEAIKGNYRKSVNNQ